MATVTIFKCDRCSKEFPNRDTIKCISAGVGDYHGDSAWFKSWRADWCFECLAQMGLPQKADKTPRSNTPTPPTLEDMIREIVRQELP